MAPGKLCRNVRLRRTVYSFKGMCTLYDAGRYFLSDLAVQLKQVNEMFAQRSRTLGLGGHPTWRKLELVWSIASHF